MITTKERAVLRGIAQNLDPIFQVGKNGVTDTLAQQLSEALDARELIKINVLKACDYTPKEVIAELSDRLNADPVQAIGNKIVLYRKSENKDIKHYL